MILNKASVLFNLPIHFTIFPYYWWSFLSLKHYTILHSKNGKKLYTYTKSFEKYLFTIFQVV